MRTIINLIPSSLKKQFFAIFILISLTPLFITSYFSQYFMLDAGTQFINENTVQYMLNGTRRMNDFLKSMEQPLNELMIDPNFQLFLNSKEDMNSAQSLYINDVRPYFQKTLLRKPEVASLLFLDRFGKAYHETADLNVARDYSYSFVDNPIYKRVFNSKTTQFIEPHQQSYTNRNRDIVSLVVPMRNFKDFTIDAWMIIELNVSALINIMHQIQPETTGSILLYNAKNEAYLTSSNMQEDLRIVLRDLFAQNQSNSGSLTINISNLDYQMAYHKLEIGDWKMISLTPLNKLMQGIYSTRLLTISITAISVVVAISFSYLFITKLLKPLYKIKKSMEMFGRGSVSKVNMSVNNELGYLINTFNRMLDERNELERELVQTTSREKEKELLQLQAQVNPHFLFNVLGMIETLAMQDKKWELREVVHEVSQILRYNIRIEGGWVSLGEEIKYIQHFQKIHYYRHGRSADIVFRIDSNYYDIPVIKLGLQPFVENALKYGWSTLKNADYFAVHFQAIVEGDCLHITITDNGPGFEPTTLLRLKELANSDAEQIHPYFANHTGIYNVYRRCRLVYGEAFIMTVDNLDHSGAHIALSIPILSSDV
jgi:two-component system sensor histidine kinase YesM